MAENLPNKLKFHLFFDQALGQDVSFTKRAIEAASGESIDASEFSIYSAQSGAVLGEKSKGHQASKTLEFLRDAVEDGRVSLGVTLIGKNYNWYIRQETPVSLGVLGSSETNIDRITKHVDAGDFISCETLRKWGKQRIQEFDLIYGNGSYGRILSEYCV